MLMGRIFKRKAKEQGRQEGYREGFKEGFREGYRETAIEYTEAYANLRQGESLQEAVERLRKENAKDG